MTANPADAVREALPRFRFYEGYSWDGGADIGGIEEELDGDYVLYADHARIVAALSARVEELELKVTEEKRTSDALNGRLAALAGAAPVAWEGSALEAVLDGGQPVAWRVRTPYGVGYKFAPELISYMDNRDPEPHAPAKAREVTEADVERACRIAYEHGNDDTTWNEAIENKLVSDAIAAFRAAMRAALATLAEGE